MKPIESYNLGDIKVVISESDQPEKVHVDCNDGSFHSEFTVRVYEYKHYKRHMNQTILKAYREAQAGEVSGEPE